MLESHRRYGIGYELVKAAAQEALRSNCERLELNVTASHDDVRRFYERSGLKWVGEVVYRCEDDILRAFADGKPIPHIRND